MNRRSFGKAVAGVFAAVAAPLGLAKTNQPLWQVKCFACGHYSLLADGKYGYPGYTSCFNPITGIDRGAYTREAGVPVHACKAHEPNAMAQSHRLTIQRMKTRKEQG